MLTETDRDILIRLVESKLIPDGTKSRLIDNYKFFSGKIADRDLRPAEIYESIGKLQIVNITLDRTVDDAQAIFESLNSTGKELSESDLIRNYVLMGLHLQSRPMSMNICGDRWNSFLSTRHRILSWIAFSVII